MRTAILCLTAAGLGAGFTVSEPQDGAGRSSEQVLESYVEDFRWDGAATTARSFGVRVDGEGGGTWTVAVRGAQSADGKWGVDLAKGAPQKATFVYTVDAATLAAIDAGRLNALTAQGKASSGDVSPMDVEWMDGAAKFDVNPFSFHFWTRGLPEKVPFGSDMTRKVHGADNVAFYYEEGIRTIWSKLDNGDRVNNGPGQPMVVPFPVMVFAIAGRSLGTVGGKPVEAKAGEMVFIPPMTPYEWWNDDDEPAEAILVMFGDGA